LYYYFDLKKTKTQTAYNIACSFLKQIAWPPEKDRTYLKAIYENIKISADRPSQDTIIKLFIQCAKSINIRILFDALDECRDDELGKVFQLIERFREANVGISITTRPHIVDLIRKQKWSADAAYMENIEANKADTGEYLRREMKSHRELIDAEFMNDIVCTIGNGEGMYRLY